jgi:hypothetical protein
MEVIGDSITCAYGNDISTDDPTHMHFHSKNENAYMSYAMITARALSAQVNIVAASGRGMYRNWDSAQIPTMPQIYPLVIPSDPTILWDFTRYVPDVVVINLGTNDFSPGTWDREQYRKTYVDFLKRLRSNYPLAFVIVAIGPMMSDAFPPGKQALTSIRDDVHSILATWGDTNCQFLEFPTQTAPYGEDWHPSIETHIRMAGYLTRAIRQKMSW